MDKYLFDEKDFSNVPKYIAMHAKHRANKALYVVANNAFSDIRNLPKLRYPKKIKGVTQPIPLQEYVGKWVETYFKGFDNRPSQRTANKSSTFADPIMALALSYRSSSLAPKDLGFIEEGHGILMTTENLIGDMLEEYLALELAGTGWYCCWGSCIDAVDFCQDKGRLLQVKNSDNSENSSSSRVRNGTTIEKWYRRKSRLYNTFNWAKLVAITGVKTLSEQNFRLFVEKTIKANPSCIYIDPTNKHIR